MCIYIYGLMHMLACRRVTAYCIPAWGLSLMHGTCVCISACGCPGWTYNCVCTCMCKHSISESACSPHTWHSRHSSVARLNKYLTASRGNESKRLRKKKPRSPERQTPCTACPNGGRTLLAGILPTGPPRPGSFQTATNSLSSVDKSKNLLTTP